jgi:hypothetical protein
MRNPYCDELLSRLRHEGELTDAMVKRQTLGITPEVIWERFGYSPTNISRMEAMQTADTLLAAATTATAATAPPGPSSTGNAPAEAVAACWQPRALCA